MNSHFIDERKLDECLPVSGLDNDRIISGEPLQKKCNCSWPMPLQIMDIR